MIKRYTQFINEGLMQHLKGPSKDEMWEHIKVLTDTPYTMLEKTCKSGLVEHLDEVINVYEDFILKHNSFRGEKSLYDLILDYGVEYNQLDVIKYALDKGAKDTDGVKLVNATENGNLDIIKLLVDFYKKEKFHLGFDYLLKKAALNGYLDVVKYFISKGADVNSYNTVLEVSKNNNFEVLKVLVENGGDFHKGHEEALRFAATYGYYNIVKYLLDRGADIHALDDTALIWAAEDNKFRIVKLLLDRGADIHAQNDEAMKQAIKNKRTKVIEVLNKYMEK